MAARFYALIGRRWGFTDEEAMLALQLRAAEAAASWPCEFEAVGHLRAARSLLEMERAELICEEVAGALRAAADKSVVRSCGSVSPPKRRASGESEF